VGLSALQIARPATAHPRGQIIPSTLVTLAQVDPETTTDELHPNLSPAAIVRIRRTSSPDSGSRPALTTLRRALVDAVEVAVAVTVAQALRRRSRGIGAAVTHQTPVIARGRRDIPVLRAGVERTTAITAPSIAVDAPRTIIEEALLARTRRPGGVLTTCHGREATVAPSHLRVQSLAAADATLDTQIPMTVAVLPEADP
jgi:hypothetical protein